jgi:hypothetical protein
MDTFHHLTQRTEELFLDPPDFESQSGPYIPQPSSSFTGYHSQMLPPSHAFLPTRETLQQNLHAADPAPSYSSGSSYPSRPAAFYHSSGLERLHTPFGQQPSYAYPNSGIVPVRPRTPEEDPDNISEIMSSAASSPEKQDRRGVKPPSKRQRTAMHPSQAIIGARTRQSSSRQSSSAQKNKTAKSRGARADVRIRAQANARDQVQAEARVRGLVVPVPGVGPVFPSTTSTTSVRPPPYGSAIRQKKTSRTVDASDVWAFVRALDSDHRPSNWEKPDSEPTFFAKPKANFVGCRLCSYVRSSSHNQNMLIAGLQ